jgi:hypothetical protein
MADGKSQASEGKLTPAQRVDAGIADARFGQVGLGSLGIGERMGTGGGGGGQFVFADLAELKSVTDQWKAERDRIVSDGKNINRAIELCTPPAGDLMSKYQANALKESLTQAFNHNQAMFQYADGYVRKLEVSQESMAATEQDNVTRLRTSDNG